MAVFSQYCKWAVELDDPARAVEVLERAVLVARSGRPGPVFVALPEDVLDELTEGPSGEVALPVPPRPDPAALDAVLRELLAAQRPAILAGGGVLASPGAYDTLVRFAEAAEVPVFTAWRRHDAFPNDHRLYLGSASLGQPRPVWERLAASDVVLAIGTRFQQMGTRDYTVPGRGQRVLLVDVEPTSATGTAIARRVSADAGVALAFLLARLPQPPPGAQLRRPRNDAERAAYLAAIAPRRESATGPGTVDPTAVIEGPPAALAAGGDRRHRRRQLLRLGFALLRFSPAAYLRGADLGGDGLRSARGHRRAAWRSRTCPW